MGQQLVQGWFDAHSPDKQAKHKNIQFVTENTSIQSDADRIAAEEYGHSLILILQAVSSGRNMNLERY